LTRPTPGEDAVVSEMKSRDEKSSSDDGTDAVVEAAAPEEPEAVQEPDVPEDELTVAKRERDEYLDLAKRTQADFENYKKRSAKEMTAAGARARIGVIREVLPVVDNLERALSVVPAGGGDAFVEGVRLVHMALQGALQRSGVETIEPAGDVFDPNVHEALSMRPQEGAQSGTVLDVVEKGYRTADTVVRPARVVVAS
jgi:molecular chaperone GrpE